jgi:hypothetical protein
MTRLRRSGALLVQLLLMSEKQISTGKASGTLWAFEGFLLGVGTFMSFQVL